MKAIATPPNQPTSYVALTSAEITSKAAEETQLLADKPMRDWLASMSLLDLKMPRSLEETMDATGTVGFSVYIVEKYNQKKALRATKPI